MFFLRSAARRPMTCGSGHRRSSRKRQLEDRKGIACRGTRPPLDAEAERLDLCKLYSITKGQQAIRQFTGAMRDRTGNMPPLPGIYPNYSAPIVRNQPDGRELTMARWGMPAPLFALKGKKSDPGVTNVRNVGSPHWRRWLGVENRCVALDFGSESEGRRDLFAFLTTDANKVAGAIHPKAMPVILTRRDRHLDDGTNRRSSQTATSAHRRCPRDCRQRREGRPRQTRGGGRRDLTLYSVFVLVVNGRSETLRPA
jgi:hypothetical protein